MPSPIGGPCSPYATEIDLCCLVSGGSLQDPCLTNGQPVSSTIINNSLQVASEIMWANTGRQFGLCEVTVKPCHKQECDPCDTITGSVGFPWVPVLENGVWTNVSCLAPKDCQCGTVCAVPLPYPIDDITEVEIDGVTLTPLSYRVDDFRNLIRTDGLCWPKCSDSWSVTLTYGRPAPALVRMATASLACELAKSCVGAPCELPKRMQSMTRQGVTVGFIDPMEFMRFGMTGIYMVDKAIKTFNPKGLQRQAAVYSPDASDKWRRAET